MNSSIIISFPIHALKELRGVASVLNIKMGVLTINQIL